MYGLDLPVVPGGKFLEELINLGNLLALENKTQHLGLFEGEKRKVGDGTLLDLVSLSI
jgi:hypothetical protein